MTKNSKRWQVSRILFVHSIFLVLYQHNYLQKKLFKLLSTGLHFNVGCFTAYLILYLFYNLELCTLYFCTFPAPSLIVYVHFNTRRRTVGNSFFFAPLTALMCPALRYHCGHRCHRPLQIPFQIPWTFAQDVSSPADDASSVLRWTCKVKTRVEKVLWMDMKMFTIFSK